MSLAMVPTDSDQDQGSPVSVHESKAKEAQNQNKTAAHGLDQAEAHRRLSRYGYNEITEQRTSPVIRFLSYYWGPIPWMIEAAALLSAVVHHWADFAIIMVLLVMNALVGFFEEYQASNAVDALKANLALKARVKRDNIWKSLPARELVPGDLIRLRLGDIVPADAELVQKADLEVDQSALTGESLPIKRRFGEKVFSGSIIRQGESDALVAATGSDTLFGHTAKLVQSAHSVSHFQQAILRIGNFLIVIAMALVAAIVMVAVIRGDPLVSTLEFALILTVAAIPVAMPAVLSVTMATGARRLTKHQAIVTRLSSIEELAGVDVLCSDKTGTLTENRLAVAEPFCVEPNRNQDVIEAAALASRAEDQDAIDTAIINALPDAGILSRFTVDEFVPFNPVSKLSQATITDPDGRTFRVAKGAPQVILKLANVTARQREQADQVIKSFASKGFRSLGVARSDDQQAWQFIGIIPLHDPPRVDASETIKDAQNLGLTIKLVTGDQIAIAREIAREIGLGDNIESAGRFVEEEDRYSESGLARIEAADGFAQVYPEHKYRIVDMLQNAGHIVAMTGDGVNDAPALKKADAGVAVAGSTDAARAAAAIVLLSPGLGTITRAIVLSRKIFQRMTTYAIYRIAETIRVLLFMSLSILAFNFYPVTAAMIVLLAVLNDGPILSIAFDRVSSSPRPEKWRMREVLTVATVLGAIGVVASFGLFYLGDRVLHLDRDFLQTLIFLKLAVAGHLTIFITRTRGPFWSSRPSGALFWSAVITKVMATLAAVYGVFMAPITLYWALIVWGYSLAWLIINDLVKRATYRVLDATSSTSEIPTIGSKPNLNTE
jgi:H+-transporting ATPase